MTKLIMQFSTKIGKNWIVSNQECPGSAKGNRHNLVIVNPESGNKLCKNEKCYFVIQYQDGSGAWQKDFDYKNASFDKKIIYQMSNYKEKNRNNLVLLKQKFRMK